MAISGQTRTRDALRSGAGLLDRSERGKLALSGSEAKAALNALVTNEIETLQAGSGLYAAVLTPKGRMLGDLRVLDTGDELLLDTERAALQGVFDALRHGLVGFDAHLHKRTLQRGLLSLIGPHSRTVAGAAGLASVEYANAAARIDDVDVVLAATDIGVDVICRSEDTERVRAALLAAGAVAAQEDDADVLRVEAGRPRYGIDLDDATIPQEGGLNERAVSFTKGCYPGQETVARLFYKGRPNRRLCGLRLSAPVAAGAPLLLGERAVGTLTSSVVSPVFGPIGLALVRREAEVGATLVAGSEGVTAVVVDLPFAVA